MDKKYRDELLLALRLHDISGKRVGEVLAEVETHVADTGEDPVEAFGQPREYAARVAAELDSSSGKPTKLAQLGGGLGTALLMFFGLQLVLDAVLPDSGTPPGGVAFTLADVVASFSLLICTLLGVVLLFRAGTALERRWVYSVAGVVVFAVGVAAAGLARWLVDDDSALLVLPRWFGLGVGVVLLAGAVVLLVNAVNRGRIVDPR